MNESVEEFLQAFNEKLSTNLIPIKGIDIYVDGKHIKHIKGDKDLKKIKQTIIDLSMFSKSSKTLMKDTNKVIQRGAGEVFGVGFVTIKETV